MQNCNYKEKFKFLKNEIEKGWHGQTSKRKVSDIIDHKKQNIKNIN
jgi:hypothetical protein